MILIYAFSNQWGTNISHRTLLEIQKLISRSDDINFQLVHWPKQFFQKYIHNNHYSLIIGLGDGSKFISKIKIETQAKNAYNDQSIYPFSPILLDLSLPNVDIYDANYFQISSNMGTYNCNYLAYSTQLYINQHSPDTQHLILLLPPGFNAAVLAQKIRDLLQQNHIF
jgi:pyrrolidone-carboxylate peptidase